MIPKVFAQEGVISAVDKFIPGGINEIFNFGLGVAAILALGTIAYAGILYSTAGDNESKQKESKTWIWAAIKGLGLIAFGYVLLNIINPNITKVEEIEIPKLEYNDLAPLEYYVPYSSISSAGIINPVGNNAIIGSVYGMRYHPIDKYCKPHRGLDIDTAAGNADCNTLIYAAKDGIFRKHPFNADGFGWYATVEHVDNSVTYYAHMNNYVSSLNSGDQVIQGQPIGYMGSTGKSTGCHLHFELRKLNPSSGKVESVNINSIFGVSAKQTIQESPCL